MRHEERMGDQRKRRDSIGLRSSANHKKKKQKKKKEKKEKPLSLALS